ncbi:MAG: hypothetical protein WEA04_03790 [Candidatus Andersenbacteria bacterium]
MVSSPNFFLPLQQGLKKYRRLLVFSVSTFLLNFLWESWHAVYLYQGFPDGQPRQISSLPDFVLMMTDCALTDMLLLLLVLALGAIFFKDAAWFNRRTSLSTAVFVGLAVGIAVVIEFKAVYIFHQWSYRAAMPTIFGLGLSPLVQLPLTGLLALSLTKPSPS